MSMWEPFTEPARLAIVQAQNVAQLFGSSFIGTEHMLFALADRDDALGALLAGAVDRDAIKVRLGTATQAPQAEMKFTEEAKRSIELAFMHARRLGQNFIGAPNLALGILDAEPPVLVEGASRAGLQAAIESVARKDTP